MGPCETVKIKFDNEDGFALLNADAFDETKHELFTESPENVTSSTAGDTEVEKTAPVAKIPAAGGAAPKQPWASKKDKL